MIAQTAAKMRAHLEVFSGRLSVGLSKPARRFVEETLYGIAARGSGRLTEIARARDEPIAMVKTETRLSRNLARPEETGQVKSSVSQHLFPKRRETLISTEQSLRRILVRTANGIMLCR